MAEQDRSKKSKRKVVSDETHDIGFTMSIIDDPVGRKVLMTLLISWIFLVGYISNDMMYIMSGAVIVTCATAFFILRYGCGVNIMDLVKTVFFSDRPPKSKLK